MDFLNPQQREAVLHSGGPLLIVAGAGSGKTKTLTHRIAHHIASGVRPEHILAITFTNKAANEMKERIGKLLDVRRLKIDDPSEHRTSNIERVLPFVGTFHAWGARLLRHEAKHLGRTPDFSIFDEDDALRLLKSIVKTLNIDAERFKPQMFRSRISRMKNELADVGKLTESNHPTDQLAARMYVAYEAALSANNAFDFDDLLEKVVRLFVARPEVLASYRARHQHIFIDEYQDVNAVQYQLVKFLGGNRGTLSVVGDDAQSIYMFRGSDFRNFLRFDTDWPNTKVVFLEENYRSTGNIIAAASALIGHNTMQKKKQLWTKHENGPLVSVAGVGTADDEAYYVVGQIASLLRAPNVDPDIAILYRTNAQSRPIEYALLKNGIPYRIYGGLRFYARMEIKDIVCALQYAANPKNTMAAERIKKNFNKKEATALFTQLPEFGAKLRLLELLGFILKTTNYIATLKEQYQNGEERIENVNELLSFASTYNDAGLPAFLEQVSLATSSDSANGSIAITTSKSVVTLMTIHASKGLEFNQVFVVGVTDGVLPHERSLARNDELEEERRLMYVAMTRARQLLTLTFYGTASRFLYELPPELLDFKNFSKKSRNFNDDSFEDEDYIEYD